MAELRWIRSFPATIPPGRNYVVDGIDRILMDLNYVPVLEQLACDTVMVEWDLAVSSEDRDRFTRHVQADREHLQVAPYRLYPVSTGLAEPVWAHRHGDAARGWRWLDEGDSECDWFAFGMIYLPHSVVRAYLASGAADCSDGTFSAWHQQAVAKRVPVHWDVRPVHLHY